jgi:uncharacterized membrane protein
MRALMITLAATAAVCLAGCSKPDAGNAQAHGAPAAEAEPADPTPPASAPTLGGIDLSSDIKVQGVGAKWDLDIGADQLKLTRPGKPELDAKNDGPRVKTFAADWRVTATDGTPLVVVLSPQKCVGVGGAVQPLTALVSAGVETLKGCAAGAPAQAAAAGAAPQGAPIDAE